MSCSEGSACSTFLPEESSDWVLLMVPREELKAFLAQLSREALGVTDQGLLVGRFYQRVDEALAEPQVCHLRENP